MKLLRQNGKQTLVILAGKRSVDVVITDIQIQEMDDVKLIQKIGESDEYHHIVIISNTQFGDQAQEEKLLTLGTNDFIYKPTTPKIVEIRVRNALARL